MDGDNLTIRGTERRNLGDDDRLTLGSWGADREERLRFFRLEFDVVPCRPIRAACGHRTILIQESTRLCFECAMQRRRRFVPGQGVES